MASLFRARRKNLEIEPVETLETLSPAEAREITKEYNDAADRLTRAACRAEAVNRDLGRNIAKIETLQKRPRR